MADTKISALPSGAPAQAGDEYVIARGGANYKLTLTNIAASMPPIGATTPNTGAFTTLSASGALTLSAGNLAFTGTAQRITGDFSNATLSNRLAFQTSTTNGNTIVGAFPNGTGLNARLQAFSTSDPANASTISFEANGGISQSAITADKTGTGTYLPMTFYTGGSERVRIDTSGNVGIGTASPGAKLDVQGGRSYFAANSDAFATYLRYNSSTAGVFLGSPSADAFQISKSNGAAYLNIDSSGNVGIGVSPVTKLHVYGAGTTSTGYTNGDATGATLLLQDSSGGAGNGGQLLFGAGPGIFAGIKGFLVNGTGPAGYLLFQTRTTSGNVLERMRITNDGEVYIAGTTDQGAYNLQCNGTGVWGAGAYVNGSDERLKDDITTLNDGLNVVSQLRPVTFKYKPDYSKDQSVQPGFIAQELQAALNGKDYVDGVVQAGPNHLNVAYQSLIPILTKAIQEQQAMIDELKAKVAALEAK